jgi:hypothetical protein
VRPTSPGGAVTAATSWNGLLRLGVSHFNVSGNAVGKVEYYRAKALECDVLADKATDAEARRLLREAAEDWRILAAQVEQLRLQAS